jgi:hypothetical protein
MLHDSSSFIICCVVPPHFQKAQVDAPCWLLNEMGKSYTMHYLLCKQQDLMTSWNLGSIIQAFTPKANYYAMCCIQQTTRTRIGGKLKFPTSARYIKIGNNNKVHHDSWYVTCNQIPYQILLLHKSLKFVRPKFPYWTFINQLKCQKLILLMDPWIFFVLLIQVVTIISFQSSIGRWQRFSTSS